MEFVARYQDGQVATQREVICIIDLASDPVMLAILDAGTREIIDRWPADECYLLYSRMMELRIGNRQRPAGALGAQDTHRHLAGRAAGHGGVLDVDGQLLDRAGLDRIDGPATLVRAELKQIGRSSVGVDHGLGLRLEVDGVGHDCLLLRATVPDQARTARPPSRSQGQAPARLGTRCLGAGR